MKHTLPYEKTYSFNMEEKGFKNVIKETVLRMFNEELKKNSKMYLGDICEAIMSGTLSAIGIIAHAAGEDPNEVVKDVVTHTYELACTD